MRKAADWIQSELHRDAESAHCRCNGYADIDEENPPTSEEIKAYDCGRSYACCTDSYKCRVCGDSFIARKKSPEMGYE